MRRRLNRALYDFETLAEVGVERRFRIGAVFRQIALEHGWTRRRQLMRLLVRLEGASSRLRGSMANPVCMHRLRKRVAGHVWKLAAETSHMAPITCTLFPRGWEVPAGQLRGFNPEVKLAALRRLINSHGGDVADGYLVAFIDGEFEPRRAVYQMHLHVLAAGEFRRVTDKALRSCPTFRPNRAAYGVSEWVYRRIRVDPGLSNLPRQLTYLVKGYWPSRWQGFNAAGKLIRARGKKRIPEPHHTEVLLWMDRWRLNDIALLMNVRAGRSGFVLAPRAYTNDVRP